MKLLLYIIFLMILAIYHMKKYTPHDGDKNDAQKKIKKVDAQGLVCKVIYEDNTEVKFNNQKENR